MSSKYDGTRVKVEKEGNEVKLTNRRGIDYTGRLPESIAALKKIHADFVGDSEAVYINPMGQVEFTPCQSLIIRRQKAVQHVGFCSGLLEVAKMAYHADDV